MTRATNESPPDSARWTVTALTANEPPLGEGIKPGTQKCINHESRTGASSAGTIRNKVSDKVVITSRPPGQPKRLRRDSASKADLRLCLVDSFDHLRTGHRQTRPSGRWSIPVQRLPMTGASLDLVQSSENTSSPCRQSR